MLPAPFLKSVCIACAFVLFVCGNATALDPNAPANSKTVSQVGIDRPREIADWEEPVGDVQVLYSDESTEYWTREKNCTMAQLAPDTGVVGWIVCELEENGDIRLHRGVPITSSMVFYQNGKLLAKLASGKPFIEEWSFSDDGKHVIVKSRASHGPAVIERFEVTTGKLKESVPAFGPNAPSWAEPYLD